MYIINTCTVTNTSDIKSRKMIRKAIRNNPDACIVAMGCFIEANKDFSLPGLDIILGNRDKSKIVELLDEWFTKKSEIRRLYASLPYDFEDMYINEFPGRTRAFVKIQDGCENFCAYCIIPYVRGKCRSKDPDLVIREITDLVNNGYQEVVLTGIHTGNYGVDLDTNFASLLSKIVSIPGLMRLRISSIEITELTKDVLDVIKNFTKMHVFPYSERKGTKAMELPEHVDINIKKERARRLLTVSKELEMSYYQSFVGKEVAVLVEEVKNQNSYGHTDNYLHVQIPDILPHNTFVTVEIVDVSYPYCIGRVSLLK